MLSSRNREEDIAQGLAAGAQDYLTKPFRPSELLTRVKRLMPPIA
jgi:DNA-binding response OmpR family regulator